jgi:ACR3 family arsenite transporter
LRLTVVLIFASQADHIIGRWLHGGLIAIPILIQVYCHASRVYSLRRLSR